MRIVHSNKLLRKIFRANHNSLFVSGDIAQTSGHGRKTNVEPLISLFYNQWLNMKSRYSLLLLLLG